MKSIFLVLLGLVLSLQVSAQVVIGNAGEGVLSDDGKLYLRDLYEGGVAENPYVYAKTPLDSIKMFEWKLAGLSKLGIDQNLLLLKLTDAELTQVGLGLILIDTIDQLNWFLVEKPMQAFPDMGDRWGVSIPEGRRRSLAVRSEGTIMIQKENFEMLAPVQKVALILHEAVSSLVKVRLTRSPGAESIQRSIPARQLIAFLFSDLESLLRNRFGHGLSDPLKDEFNIDWDHVGCWNSSLNFSFSIYERGQEKSSWTSSGFIGDKGKPLSVSYWNMARNVCEQLAMSSSTSRLSVSLMRRAYRLQFIKYTNRIQENSFNQVGFAAVAQPWTLMSSPSSVELMEFKGNVERCTASLSRQAELWFSGLLFPWPVDSFVPLSVVMTCSNP